MSQGQLHQLLTLYQKGRGRTHPNLTTPESDKSLEFLVTARQFSLLKREADIALVTGAGAAAEAAVRDRAAVIYDSRRQTQTVI